MLLCSVLCYVLVCTDLSGVPTVGSISSRLQSYDPPLAPDLPETWSLQCLEPVCWVQSLQLTRFVFVVFRPCHLPGTVTEAVNIQHFGTWLSNTAEWECAVGRHWVAKSHAYQPIYLYVRVEQKVLNRGLHCEGPGVCNYQSQPSLS